MEIERTALHEVFLIKPKVYSDDRGSFFESYNEREFSKAGINVHFVQNNFSTSKRGTIRGLHFQLNPYAQAKLVRVLSGSIFDVVVDIRKGSQSYGKWISTEVTAKNNVQLFVPRGFAHGFASLSAQHESGIVFNDKQLNIRWPIDENTVILSPKDRALKPFLEAENNFTYTK